MLKLLAGFENSYGPLRIFAYNDFRSALALVLAFVLTLVMGRVFIRALQHFRVVEDVRKRDSLVLDGLHSDKGDTPTMGGVIMVLSILVTTFLCADLTNLYITMAMFCMLSFAGLGMLDDYIKLRGIGGAQGLSKRAKLVGQFVLSAVVCAAMLAYSRKTGNSGIVSNLLVPGVKMSEFFPDLGRFYVVFFLVVMVGSSNAVNLTDGLDGLAAGCTMMVALSFTVLAYVAGHEEIASYLRIPFVRQADELTVFCAAMVGATLGFLWFNANPAEVFMGDTGSLALGASIAFVALAVKQELVLLVAGGVFVCEALSVIVQMLSCKFFGRRVLRCAPFHHHLQFVGWRENHIVVRLWCISVVLATLGLATLKMH